ncbi:hypothetical protein J2X36_002231 [Methylobacterium sp. BE186]|uniref:hypothetical protein n=1 Tax=Methylobacterium sp. BE186 TaxID=2817715 RepID=UPI0028626195|nr:hypothetical protein [Methylobacterium sp. BE186]MDR7037484.1 hypothetical protein [Methylobacterium sp. BE186]
MPSTPLRPTATALARYPIPVELIAALYRASASDFARLVAHMPEYGRARIAAYCVERERLHQLGVRLAATCGEAALVKAAGAEVGAALFAHARSETAEPEAGPTPAPSHLQMIDLSGGATEQAPQGRARAA